MLNEQDFKSAATGVTAKAMRAELNKLVQTIPQGDQGYKNAFEQEMQSWFFVFNMYIWEKGNNKNI